MADFCHDCIQSIFPGETSDLANLCQPGEHTWEVCEGCGPGWFDHQGKRVDDQPRNPVTPTPAKVGQRSRPTPPGSARTLTIADLPVIADDPSGNAHHLPRTPAAQPW